MQTWTSGQQSPEVVFNNATNELGHQGVYARNPDTTTGLTWGYDAGRWSGFAITAGTVTLTNTTTNYVVVKRADGVCSTSTAATNWNNRLEYARVYKITTAGGVVTAYEDHRAGASGVHGNMDNGIGKPLVSVSAARTFSLDDLGNVFLHPSADTTARTWTIDANATVAMPVGSEIEMINQNAAGVITIAITTDTMRLAGAGTTGSRTLAANGIALARKIASTEWIIDGTGLT